MVAKNAAVIGHPIGHSLSPALHGRWIEKYGLSARYEAIDGQDDDTFRDIARSLEAEGYAGANVTIPFKRTAYELVDEKSRAAEAIGAVNLLVCGEGKLLGDNTDAEGFGAALEAMDPDKMLTTARVLGAGGAAPAIVYALKQAGFSRIEILNRTASKARELADIFDIETIPWEARSDGLSGVDLLVNTTALGMAGQPPLEIEVTGLPDYAAIMDIVTTPKETPLLKAGRERGLRTRNGFAMLVHQAIPSFEAWFDIRPDDAEEAIAFLENLGG